MTTTGRVDRASRLMGAPASAVYEAFVSPERMVAWLPPQGMSGEMIAFDFREGGGYRIRLVYLEPDHVSGKTSADSDEVEVSFTRLVPGRRIEQSVRFESQDPGYSQDMKVNWVFEESGADTMVTVFCENVPGAIAPEDHEAGLRSTLENLAWFVEGGNQ